MRIPPTYFDKVMQIRRLLYIIKFFGKVAYLGEDSRTEGGTNCLFRNSCAAKKNASQKKYICNDRLTEQA